MSQFPIILIPNPIEQTRVAQPPVPSFNLPVPQPPAGPPKKISKTLIGVQTAIAVVLSFVLGNIFDSSLIGTVLLIASLGGISFSAWRQFTNYSQKKKKHQEKIAIYRSKKSEYDEQKRLHYQEHQTAQTPEKIADFRNQLLLEVLAQTIPHDRSDSDAPAGWSESYFSPYLTKYFADNIYTKLSLAIPNFSRPYSPDFAYIQSEINLYIDIEIDEPYAYKSKQPTHFIDANKDLRRDQFFMNKGWLVIRFSEEQILKYPDSCCKTIAETIANLLGDNLILNQFKNVSPLPQMKQWTYEEAEQMAMTEYRNTYL